MTDTLKLFLNELNATEGSTVKKKKRIVFETAIDEARYIFVADSMKQIDALQNMSGRQDKRGAYNTAWTQLDRDGSVKVTFKSGTKVLELVEGKTYFVCQSVDAACQLIAKAAIAAERGEMDAYLSISKKQKKPSTAGDLIDKLKKQWVPPNAEARLDAPQA